MERISGGGIMKLGDIIHRKDMPDIYCKIVGENKKWDMWVVEIVSSNIGFRNIKKRLIAKDDERWEVVKEV